MAHLALYRQYRPTTFEKVIGQEHITTILLHQIAQGQPSHAYLFCGSRGTGKTSTAKILARAINCLDNHKGEPCGVCDNCRAALTENGDIIEIDAASNNGVDNVRDLIEQAQFMPLQLTHRVFIIDEVHMLSTSAFNALLKTLEEPPAHVVFILATTEPQKLPATIISRCQRFDFHRLNVSHLLIGLKGVLKQVGASIELEGLQLIARAADGGMRDALSLADQCLSFCGKTVTTKDVYDVLGSMEQDTLFSIADALLGRDCKSALACFNDAMLKGRDPSVFVNDLSAHFRALLLAKSCGECADLLDCTPDRMNRYLKQTEQHEQKVILYAMEQLIKAQSALRYFPTPRTLIEAMLVRICTPVDDNDILALCSRVEALENQPRTVAAPVQLAVGNEDKESAKPNNEVAPKGEPKVAAVAVPAAAVKKDNPASSNAQALWQEVCAEVQRRNGLVYMSLTGSKAVSLEGSTLTVRFPMGNESRYEISKAPINYRVVQGVLNEKRPDCALNYTIEAPTDEVAKLADIFGADILTVE